jgi:hypothetical protein
VEKKVSMVGMQIPLSQPINITPHFTDIDQVEQVVENNIQIDGCHNPFVPAIMNFEMPENFKFPVQIDPYDGTTEPQDHIEIFQQTMVF